MKLKLQEAIFYGAILAFVLFAAGCASTLKEQRKALPERRSSGSGSIAPAQVDTAQSDKTAYRLEEELPEKTPRREAQLVERMTPVLRDTFAVHDAVPEPDSQKPRYAIGYRLQVFASSDRSTAEKVRDRAAKETRMAAYLDYEDGLYKVRIGDFVERKEALAAKASVEKLFSDCWIVRTTIRTAF